jgi:glycosyltransferase involved in cell wall biosynthesis
MQSQPIISICIPAYRRIQFLDRLLKSIAIQTYTAFEVIITDDTRGNEVEEFLQQEQYTFPIKYLHNTDQLGTPLNWTAGIEYATGSWIKIMHDDDWLASSDTLQLFANEIKEGIDLIFSGYSIYDEATTVMADQTISLARFNVISNYPYYLFAKNELGPPSVLLFRKTILQPYDPALKWLVDIEGYTRMINLYKSTYVAKPLVVMSRNDTQVTNTAFRDPDIEIKEALIYYRHFGSKTHDRLKTYDAWWRLLRNLSIRSQEQLVCYAHGEKIPEFFFNMLRFQQKIPMSLLKIGVLSKLSMTCVYLFQKNKFLSNSPR